jgi:molecular chaperone GrpE
MSETKAEDTTMHPGETASPDASTTAGEPSSAPLTAEDVAALKAQAVRGAEAQERYVRLYADFENFKKRAARERDDVRRSATEAVLDRLLPVLDTFEMAMQAAAHPSVNLETLKAGVSMVQGQLRNTVGEFGVEEINAVGQMFDPLVHEAVSQDVLPNCAVTVLSLGPNCKPVRVMLEPPVVPALAGARPQINGLSYVK